MPGLQNLYGFDRAQLESLFVEQGLQAFRGRQLMKWVYHQGQTDFAGMTDLPLRMREWLAANCYFALPEVERRLNSVDGTMKWLLRGERGDLIETVLNPEQGRNTLSVSSRLEIRLD